MSILQQTLLKKRLFSFEVTFQKYADICSSCRALNIWKMGELKPQFCRCCRVPFQPIEERSGEDVRFGC